nr:serine/arginine repetitive matrix protein 3-like [Pan troglodytes]
MAESWWLTSGTPWRSRAPKTPDPDGNRLLNSPSGLGPTSHTPLPHLGPGMLGRERGGRDRRQRPGRGRSLTGGEGRSSRRLRQRRRSSSSACSFHCGRRTRSIPHNHPPLPTLPPRRLSRRRLSHRYRRRRLSPGAGARTGARERERARPRHSRHRPQPPPPAGGARAREPADGRAHASGAGMGPGRRGPAPSPPSHAVSGLAELPRCR